VGIATQMMQTPPSAAQEIPTMLHLILKTYKTRYVLFYACISLSFVLRLFTRREEEFFEREEDEF
jgi:hypothetical protein